MKTLLALLLVVILSVSHAAEINEEVYHGLTAKPGQFPFQALLIYMKPSGESGCGGSLISRKHVLTAAHCTYETVSGTVFLGVTDNLIGEGVSNFEYSPSNIRIPSDYDPDTLVNDISVIILPTAVKLTNLIKIIALPHRSWAGPLTFQNYTLTASGYGKTFDYESQLHPLQYTELPIMTPEECKKYDSKGALRFQDGMICTGLGDRDSRVCSGDSGGPLTVIKSSKLYLVGVVSWTRIVCSVRARQVFSDVAFFLPWISKTTGIPYKK